MADVTLTYISNDGTPQSIRLDDGKMSFGRGSEADHRIDDQGLSRLHATVFREDDRLWVLDENSTNGTFVNGEPTSPNGTILKNGDKIRIGHETTLTVKIAAPQASSTSLSEPVTAVNSVDAGNGIPVLIPLAIVGVAVLVIAVSATFIGVRLLGNDGPEIVTSTPYDFPPDDTPDNRNTTKTPRSTPTIPGSSPGSTPETIDNTSVETRNDGTTVVLPKGRFQDMSDDDKNRYVAVKAEKIARIIGNQKSDPIPPAAVQEIRKFLAGYVNRLKSPKKDSCESGWGKSDFVSVLTRATRTSPFVVRSFRAESIEPILGIYVAMIEGEHCPCLTSPTGAKGMFQFLASSAPDYGLDPNQRCDPEQSAKAGAKYLKTLIARFGTAPDSVPLAIASFNAGQGNLSKNLDTVFSGASGQSRSFWTLTANKGVLEGGAGKQFTSENIHYIPKFFAAAILGENPADFGVSLQPLSSYTK